MNLTRPSTHLYVASTEMVQARRAVVRLEAQPAGCAPATPTRLHTAPPRLPGAGSLGAAHLALLASRRFVGENGVRTALQC